MKQNKPANNLSLQTVDIVPLDTVLISALTLTLYGVYP